MSFSGKGKKIIASIKKQSILKKFCIFIIVAVISSSLISGIIMYHYTTKYMTESKSEDIKKAGGYTCLTVYRTVFHHIPISIGFVTT